jgi:Glycosyltransferase family 10 (fucosyltransferase) C-term
VIRVRISKAFDWPLARQTPGRSARWGSCQFYLDGAVDACDYWVVLDDLAGEETARCHPSRTIFVTCEPPTVGAYPSRFLAQFGTVITCQRGDIDFHNVVVTQQGLPWHIGPKAGGGRIHALEQAPVDRDYDFLKTMTRPPKTALISVLCSNKAFTAGHRKRIAFVNALQDHFKDRLDVYGAGFRDIADKWDAIAPYRYHIVLENSAFGDYWTEKLADCYLGWAFPFYYGCPNLQAYFDPQAFVPIDLDDAPGAIRAIEDAIAAGRDERSAAAVDIARELVLDRYNLFALLAELVEKMSASSPRPEAVPLHLRPQSDFPPGFAERSRRKLRRLVQDMAPTLSRPRRSSARP